MDSLLLRALLVYGRFVHTRLHARYSTTLAQVSCIAIGYASTCYKNEFIHAGLQPIDLVLIHQQNVGKRSLHLVVTVNAKKRWKTIYWWINDF
jgi:hypothetical protein